MNKPRNYIAQLSCFLKPGYFHYRCAPKDGARNTSREYMEMYLEDRIYPEYDQSFQNDETNISD